MVCNDVGLESPTYDLSLRANAKQSSETGATHVALCDDIGDNLTRHPELDSGSINVDIEPLSCLTGTLSPSGTIVR